MVVAGAGQDCQPSSEWKGVQDVVQCSRACSADAFFVVADGPGGDGNCKCCTGGHPSFSYDAQLNAYEQASTPAPAPAPAPPAPTPTPGPTVYHLSTPGCNAGGALSQLPPPHSNYFVGRLPISSSGGVRDAPPGSFGCDMDGWQLGLLHMDDWSSLTLSFVRTMLWPNAHDGRYPKTPIQGGRYVLDSAYDPTVAQLGGAGGEMWVSFECAGAGFYTSSCMGPLAGSDGNWTIDLARTAIVVKPPSADKAASVPKIFSFQGRDYMWFDYYRTEAGYIEARGVELQSDGQRYWAAGLSDTMLMDDARAVAVWRPGGADSAIADVFGIEPSADGRHLFVTAGVGGPGCTSPASAVDGCYRLAVGRTNFPLGVSLANEVMLDGASLPGNAQEYAKELALPSGDKLLAAHFLDKRDGSPGYAIPAGFVGIVLPRHDNAAFWALSSPCSPAQPYPGWGDRAMQCMPSCGGRGGTSSFNTPCDANGKRDVGQAYDVPYCCAD
eukprot:g3487.t1